MENKIQNAVLAACYRFMQPIARLLLKCGIGYKEFAEVSKAAFVDVATSDYGLRGRDTNVSRVAVMTGLTRKDVKRVRDSAERANWMEQIKMTPSNTILHCWHHDQAYLDKNGDPLTIQYEGDEPSFSNLVRAYGGDIPPGALKTELARAKTIEILSDGRMRPIKRFFIPEEFDEGMIRSMAFSLRNLATTLLYNADIKLHNRDSYALEGLFERYAWTERLKPRAIPRFRRLATENARNLLEFLDEWLEKNSVEKDEQVGPNVKTVGLGIYYFEEEA